MKCPVRLCDSLVNKMADQRNDRLTIDRAARSYLYAYRYQWSEVASSIRQLSHRIVVVFINFFLVKSFDGLVNIWFKGISEGTDWIKLSWEFDEILKLFCRNKYSSVGFLTGINSHDHLGPQLFATIREKLDSSASEEYSARTFYRNSSLPWINELSSFVSTNFGNVWNRIPI